MRAAELVNYLAYCADPDLDLVVLQRDKYDRLMEKAFLLDSIKQDIRRIYNKTERKDINGKT